MLRQKEESPEGNVITHEAICMLRQHQVSLLPAERQGEQTMKVPPTAPIWCLLIVCITLLAFTLLVRKSLCEIRYRDTNKEVAAFMAYESGK